MLAFIGYLVQHRDRVVPKQELLDKLWPDAVVTDSSLQRVASLARAALGPAGRDVIRTFPGHGYRCVAEVHEAQGPAHESPAEAQLRPRYAKSGDLHLAYHTQGEGDVDLVLVLGWTFSMQALSSLPEARALLEQLASRGRVITFDKRGTGMSDRVKELPSLEQRMDDLRAVLDEVRSERAILLGISEGGPLSIAFAEAYPERVAGLILVGAFPRMASAPDYPHGWKRSELGQLKGYVKNNWGAGATMLALVPEAAHAQHQAWASAVERAGASPGAALDLLEMNARIDVRDRLTRLRVPTVVLHAREDRVSSVENGRYLARQIPGATLVEVEGDDHAFLFAGSARLLQVVQELLRREANAR